MPSSATPAYDTCVGGCHSSVCGCPLSCGVFHVVMCGEACCTLAWACCCTLAWACVLAPGQRISMWLGETWLYTVASNQASTPVFSLRYF